LHYSSHSFISLKKKDFDIKLKTLSLIYIIKSLWVGGTRRWHVAFINENQ